MRFFLTLSVLATLLAGPAQAHDADVVFVQFQVGSGPGVLTEVLTLTAGTLGLLAPVDADNDGLLTQADLNARANALREGVWNDMPLTAENSVCRRGEEEAHVREGYIELRARFECAGGPLRQEFKWLSVLPPNYSVVLKNASGMLSAPLMALSATHTMPIPRTGELRTAPGWLAGLKGGVKHLWAVEHLCWLLALAWLCRNARSGFLGIAAFVAAQWAGQWAALELELSFSPALLRGLEAGPHLLMCALAAELWLGERPRVRTLLLFVAGLEHGLALPGARGGSLTALTGFGVAFALASAAAFTALFVLAGRLRNRHWVRTAVAGLCLAAAGFGLTGLISGA